MKEKFITKLQERRQNESFRALHVSKENMVDFVSNDYLGLSRSKVLFDQINHYTYEGITNLNGSTGSRLLAGNFEAIEKLEIKLANIFKGESALIFNSGYAANQSLLSSIPQKGDTIIYDSLAHICIKEGAKLSLAKNFSFKHNDIESLESKLKNASGEIFVVIESIYSMDGDRADFESIIKLCKDYNAKLIVDEAHSTGLHGENGSGLMCELALDQYCFARIMTFGKAVGVHGACIVGQQEIKDYMINFARPFIYTTALPVHSIFAIDAAFNFIKENIELQFNSSQIISFFNEEFEKRFDLNDKVSKLESHSPIQPIIIPGNQRVKQVANKLQLSGFDVRPILSPTVPEGTERLRVSIHTYNSKEEIIEMLDCLYSQLK